MPRKVSQHFKTMGYILLRKSVQLMNGVHKNKYIAFCTTCGKELANTSKNRLGAHRNVCAQIESIEDFNGEEYKCTAEDVKIISPVSMNDDIDSSSAAMNTNPDLNIDTYIEHFNKGCNKNNIDFVVDVDYKPGAQRKRKTDYPNKLKCEGKRRSIDNIDSIVIPNINKNDVNDAMGKFFFGCNIPFNIIESNYFKNLIRTLCPNYIHKIPDEKELIGHILEKEYSSYVQQAAQNCEKRSVLLLGGWKNVASNSKTLVSLISSTKNNNHIFVYSKDVSVDTQDVEILHVIEESKAIANTMYNTDIYAVVVDEALDLQKMDGMTNLWYIKSNSQTAHMLVEDICTKNETIKSCLEKAALVINECKHLDLQEDLAQYEVGTLAGTSCYSYRNHLYCINKNLLSMRESVKSSDYKIEREIKDVLFDDDFERNCKECIELLDPLCEFINKVESVKCNLADAVDLWNNLASNDVYKGTISSCIDCRRSQALSTIGLTAFYFDPSKKISNLTEEQQNKVNSFLLEELSADGIDEWTKFQEKTDIFDILFKKEVVDPLVFWKTARLKAPHLADLALKCLRIPSSNAQIKSLFSNWSFINSSVMNKLSDETARKLIHICYSLKMRDKCI